MIKSIQEEEQKEDGKKQESRCCLHEETKRLVDMRASTSSKYLQTYGIFHTGFND